MSLEKIINGIKKAACVGLTTIALMGGITREAVAKTHYVGPGQSIQAAIDVNDTKDGDEIIVEPGTYYENINFNGKNIILRSIDPNDSDMVDETVIDGQRKNSVITFNNREDVNCVLNGFTITNGYGYEKLYSNHMLPFGGGIYCEGSSPLIINCIIKDNKASYGAGIFINKSSPKIFNCIITGNTKPGFKPGIGGGVHCWHGSVVTITNSIISDNEGLYSAGLYCLSSSAEINNCEIIGNVSGGIGFSGTMTNSRISDNDGDDDSDGIVCYGDTTISNCIISGNRNRGIKIYGHSSHIYNCTITGSHINGVFCGGGDTTITNSIIWSNIYADINVREPVPVPDICRYPPCPQPPPTKLMISYSCFGTLVLEGSNINVVEKENISVVPLFVDPNDGDYHLKSQAGRWNANEGRWTKDEVTSLCIDAGDPATPVGLEPFPNGGIVNMGAYGGTEEASKSYFGKPVCETIVAGDINGDCKVDFKDFVFVALHWLEER